MSQKRIYTSEETELMIKMYNEGETYSVIAKAINTKADKVSKYLKTLGYGVRPHNKLKNHDYLSASRKIKLMKTFLKLLIRKKRLIG